MPTQFNGNNKLYVVFLKQIEANIGSLQFKCGVGKKKRSVDISGIFLMGTLLHELPGEDDDWCDFSIDDRIYGTEAETGMLSDRSKSVMRNMVTELQSEKHFVAAQKAALDVILKSLSPNLPEVLNFQMNDIFVASRLIWKLQRKYNNHAQKNIASINRDILRHIERFKKFSSSKEQLSAFFADLNRLVRMSAPSKDRFAESFLVKHVLDQLDNDERVKLQILSAKLQESPDCSLEELEFLISDKISSSEPDPEHTSKQFVSQDEPSSFLAHARQYSRKREAAFMIEGTHARGSRFGVKKPMTAKLSQVSPPKEQDDFHLYVEKIPSHVWATWSEAKRSAWKAKVKAFRSEARKLMCGSPTHITADSTEANHARSVKSIDAFDFPPGFDAFYA